MWRGRIVLPAAPADAAATIASSASCKFPPPPMPHATADGAPDANAASSPVPCASDPAGTPPTPARITGVLLAGGQGSRMGGADKGLLELDGMPMAAHVIARLLPQVDEVLISANRNAARWATFGPRVIADELSGFAGPLAGLHAALQHAHHDLVLSVPCDSPGLPRDLAARLLAGLQAAQADLAVVRVGGEMQPVFCLCRRELAGHLGDFLAAGGRGVGRWQHQCRLVAVDFDDQPAAFDNLNTPAELAQLSAALRAARCGG